MNKVEILVQKFGGTANATWRALAQIINKIILTNLQNRLIVVSAPGARYKGDKKVTDLLFQISRCVQKREDWSLLWAEVRQRYLDIIIGLNFNAEFFHSPSPFGGPPQNKPDNRLIKWGAISDDEGKPISSKEVAPMFTDFLDSVEQSIRDNPYEDFIVRLGEYMQAWFLAEVLKSKGYEATFVDTKDCVFFKQNGEIDEEKTHEAIRKIIPKTGFVVFSGYYGISFDGKIKVFSRGGTDLTATIVAKALSATRLIKWTDVDGIASADPRKVQNTRILRKMTYSESRLFSYAGSEVLHESTFPFLRNSGVTVCVRNIYKPESAGTEIVPSLDSPTEHFVGVIGGTGFSVLTVKKLGSHEEHGFLEKILETLVRHQISVDFEINAGFDNSAVAIRSAGFIDRETVVKEIQETLDPDDVSIVDGVGIINFISRKYTDFDDANTELLRNGIKLKSRSHVSDNGQVVATLNESDTPKAVQIIHDRFFPPN